PWSETYKVSAPKWAIEVSRTLNAWTGGNQARSGLLDISPDVLEHYLEFAMGGVGKFVLNAVHTGERIVTGDEWLPEKMPFVRGLCGKSTAVPGRGEFDEAWDEVDAAFYEVRDLAKDGDIAGSRAARQRYRAELSAYGVMKATAKTLREMRKQKDRIEADKTLSATEKRRRLDELRKRENALIMKALATYAKARQDAERAPVAEQ